MSEPDKPIACSLDRGAYGERIAEIGTLFAHALRSARRDGPRLHLTFDPAARVEIEAMVRKERACCAFLDFALGEANGALTLTITAPPQAGAGEVLEQFATAAHKTVCAC